MSFELAEGAVNAVIAYFNSAQAAKLAALNTAYSGDGLGITLAAWTAVSDVERVEIEPQMYPYLEVLAVGGEVLSENAGFMTAKHTLALHCWVMDDISTSALRRRLMRYVRAIVELVKDGRSSALMRGYPASVAKWAFDMWKRPDSKVVGHVVVGLTIAVSETYP